MAITYKGAGTAAANTVSSTTLAVPYPSNIGVGDAIVLWVSSASSTGLTLGADWLIGGQQTAGGNVPRLAVWIKVADGSESGSFNVTTGNATSQGRMHLFNGVDCSNPQDVAATTFGTSSAVTAYDLPTLTTTVTGVCLFYAGAGNAAASTFTPPTNPATFTEEHDVNTTSPHTTAGYLIWSGSGATGTVNLVRAAAVRGTGILIALRPAPSQPTSDTEITDLAAITRPAVPKQANAVPITGAQDLVPVLQSSVNKRVTLSDFVRSVRRVSTVGTQQTIGTTSPVIVTNLTTSLEPGTWKIKVLMVHTSNNSTNGNAGGMLNCSGGTVTRIAVYRRTLANGSNNLAGATTAGSFFSMKGKGQRTNNTDMTGYGGYDTTAGFVITVWDALIVVTSTTSLQVLMTNEIAAGNNQAIGAESTLIAEKVA